MPLLMQLGSQNALVKKLELAADFLYKSIELGIPANTMIFINTHSDTSSGSLQYTGGRMLGILVQLSIYMHILNSFF
jgi:hypothetical protein